MPSGGLDVHGASHVPPGPAVHGMPWGAAYVCCSGWLYACVYMPSGGSGGLDAHGAPPHIPPGLAVHGVPQGQSSGVTSGQQQLELQFYLWMFRPWQGRSEFTVRCWMKFPDDFNAYAG